MAHPTAKARFSNAFSAKRHVGTAPRPRKSLRHEREAERRRCAAIDAHPTATSSSGSHSHLDRALAHRAARNSCLDVPLQTGDETISPGADATRDRVERLPTDRRRQTRRFDDSRSRSGPLPDGAVADKSRGSSFWHRCRAVSCAERIAGTRPPRRRWRARTSAGSRPAGG